jgi:hypothetical protein
MARFSLSLLIATVALFWSASSAEAQYYYQYPNGAVAYVLPRTYVYPQHYWVPYNRYGAIRPRLPVFPRVTVQRTQLDPMRHFFTGNGSSYSPGTVPTWSSPRRTGF